MIDSKPINPWTHLTASCGRKQRGKQDGTGPAKDSSERKSGKPGKGQGPCKGSKRGR